MKYGYFDDKAREYVITEPLTPYPWINYLGTKDFFSLISNTAGGYSFYRDARLRRITRYRYNDVPPDSNGRYFYINDGGTVWSPGYRPVQTPLDFYRCRHGLGYSVIEGQKDSLEASVTYFVPLEDNCEIERLTLVNHGRREKKFSVFSCVEFCLWNAMDDMTNFQRNLNTGEVEIEGSTIYHITEYRERRNHYAFYSVNAPVDGFDSDREAFLGLYNGYGRPQAVFHDQAENSVADGWSPIASYQIRVKLAPGEKKEFIFLLGYAENPRDRKFGPDGRIEKSKAAAMRKKFDTPAKVDRAFADLHGYWDALLSRFALQSADDRLNRMVNIWNPYQCMVTFNLSRSASYFESGIGRGMGFRDSNQDILGFVHLIPERVRQRILDLAATQLEDGGAWHQYQPLTKKGNDEIGGNFNDDPLWLILAVSAYLKESGDFSILEENVAFNNDESKAAPLFEHLRRSFEHVVNNLGPHGLPLIGRADWNDCLNLNCFSEQPDESFQTTEKGDGKTAESVLIAGMFVFIGREFVQICKKTGHKAESEQAAGQILQMIRTIEKYGYDGEWFLRAYDSLGSKVGSKENKEGKIYIEPQGFCVMAGIGLLNGEAKSALDSVKKYLNTQYGIVLLNPAYTRYSEALGEITSYPPGYKENAGVFSHNNPWIIAAETVLGRGDQAFEYYRKTAPAWLDENHEIHRTEPYVYSQMVAGKDASRFGEAKNSWLTGAAAWNYYVVSQWILGIKPGFDGLIIEPCIPSGLREFIVSRRFRNATYRIRVRNPEGVCRGITVITVDGRRLGDNVLPVFPDGEHDVDVIMG